MGMSGIGGEYKPQLKLDENKVVVENIGCYDYNKKVDKAFIYRKETIYHFKNEDDAKEYYYINK